MAGSKSVPRGGRRMMGAQLLLVLSGLFLVAFAPPVQGQMLLIPLTAHAAARLPALALHDGTLLIAHGTLPGSLVVRGDRARLGWAMLANGVLPLASSGAGCMAAA